MRVVKEATVEAVVLLTITFVVAAGANGLRASGALEWNKNYFDKGFDRVAAVSHPVRHTDEESTDTTVSLDQRKATGSASNQNAAVDPSTVGKMDAMDDVNTQVAASAPSAASAHRRHPYQSMTFEQVAEVFNDPDTERGAHLFVDARNDSGYIEGHIPGALQCDHYRLAEYLDGVLGRAGQAEKVIVYCSGGACEDSIFVSCDLIELDVPYESIYVFEGGWCEWVAHDMPVETGREP